jgi:hypothetical protein
MFMVISFPSAYSQAAELDKGRRHMKPLYSENALTGLRLACKIPSIARKNML